MGREGKKDGEKGVSAKAKHTHSTVRLKMGNDEHYVKWINNITENSNHKSENSPLSRHGCQTCLIFASLPSPSCHSTPTLLQQQ